MNAEFFAAHIGISTEDAQTLLSLSQNQIYESALYYRLVASINRELLAATLVEVRTLYNAHLPELVDYLRSEHGHTGNPMSALTLGNWTLGFLHSKEDLHRLPSMHHRVSQDVLDAGLAPIVVILNHISDPTARAEWVRAMVLLSLPMYCMG